MSDGVVERRRWADSFKQRIVAETLLPGARVSDVARRHGVPDGYVSSWRTLARRGQLPMPALAEAPEFTPIVVAEIDAGAVVGQGPDVNACRPEIVSGAVTVRLEANASAERIAAIVRALSA